MPGPDYPTKHVPMQCAHCRQPFPISNGRVEAWRSSRGAYFCNEFCADGDELSAWTPRTPSGETLASASAGSEAVADRRIRSFPHDPRLPRGLHNRQTRRR